MSNQTNNNGRRDFIKKSVTGIAGAAIIPSILTGETKETKPKNKMIYRTLGKTGLKVPIVSMGVMNADNPQLIKAALESGMLMLDTAHYYSRGKNEESVGEAIKGIPRESYIIATKARPTTVDRASAPKGDAVKEETVESFMAKVDISLKRLGLKYVDILYYHSARSREDVFNKTALTAMQKLKKAGKIRHIGISTHSNEPEVIRAAVETKVYEVVLTAYNFRMSNLADLDKAIDEAAKAGLGIVAMKTQAGVYWDKERTHSINMKAALKWALQNENIHTSIPGFTSFDQLETDLSVMADLKLTSQEQDDLKLNKKAALSGLYCQQCGQCMKQCSKAPDIPTLMRCYMYTYGYRKPSLAKDTLAPYDFSKLACTDCSTCHVTCTMGFNVREKVMDIARIQDVPGEFLV